MPVIKKNAFFVSCDEITEDEGTPYAIDRQRSYVRRHLVEVKVKEMGPIDVCLCPGLPLPGSFYRNPKSEVGWPILSNDTLAIMVRQSAARRDKAADAWPWWVVTSEYSVDVANYGYNKETPKNDDPSTD